MRITIAHSPDSDDAYMMAPLALGWMDPEGFEIDFVRKDIEQLNREAMEARYEVTAISFGAYPELVGKYDLLTAGSSIQEGTGPLVVSRKPMETGSIGLCDCCYSRTAHLCLPRHEEVDGGLCGLECGIITLRPDSSFCG